MSDYEDAVEEACTSTSDFYVGSAAGIRRRHTQWEDSISLGSASSFDPDFPGLIEVRVSSYFANNNISLLFYFQAVKHRFD